MVPAEMLYQHMIGPSHRAKSCKMLQEYKHPCIAGPLLLKSFTFLLK
jgi:hypothetical protein